MIPVFKPSYNEEELEALKEPFFSGWIGLIDSGKTVTAKHSWSEEGDYEIKVKAKDVYDYEGEWSDPLKISIEKNKASYNPVFHWFLIRFPMLERLLSLIRVI